MARLQFQAVTKRFSPPQGGVVHAVNQVDLILPSGGFGALLGTSGSGKTTLLRLAAGLESPDQGTISRSFDPAGSSQPEVAMVFQEPSLYPHLDVVGNLELSLKFRRLSASQIQDRLASALDACGVESGLHKRFPHELSGGQQKRVALARALARKPTLLLLDEPLSGLDPASRLRMKEQLLRLRHAQTCTILMATHDQEEAFGLAQWVGVLEAGRLLQWDVPRALYDHPVSLPVASFLGSPSMNLWLGVIQVGDGGCLEFRTSKSTEVLCLAGLPDPASLLLRQRQGQPVVLGVRPERLRLQPEPKPDAPVILFGPVSLEGVEFLAGNEVICWRWGGELIRQRQLAGAMSSSSTAGRCLGVDVNALHWFDPASGLNLHPHEVATR